MSNMNISITAWLNLISLNLAARTIEIYGGELRRLAAFHPDADDSEFQESDLTLYLRSRMDAGLGPSGLGVAVGAFKRFFKWAGNNCAAGIPIPPVEESEQRTLTEEEVTAVLETCDTSSAFGVRDLAIFMVLWDSGLRASELCRLEVARVKVAERVFHVVAKGYRGRRRERQGGFSEETANQLLHWLALRSRFALPQTTTVFCSLAGKSPGKPLTRRGLQDICAGAAERATVAHFSPHAFRRGMATDSLEAGCPDEVLRRFMGWRTSKMLGVYTRAMAPTAFNVYSPVSRLLREKTK